MSVEPLHDVDSVRFVTKLQRFASWWAPQWFPPLDDPSRLLRVPPALAWAVRFPPDFFPGEFIAEVTETGRVHCFRNYGEPIDGYIDEQFTDNPVVRFETDEAFEPTLLNDLVAGNVLLWCVAAQEQLEPSSRSNEICVDTNLLWDRPYLIGSLRAWLSGNTLVVECSGARSVTQRPVHRD